MISLKSHSPRFQDGTDLQRGGFRHGDLRGDGHLGELRPAAGGDLLGHVGGTAALPSEELPHVFPGHGRARQGDVGR